MVKRIILLVFNLSSSDWEFTYSNRQKQKSWVFGTAVKVPISPSQLAQVQFSALLPTKADRGTRHVMPSAAGALPTTWASWTSSCLLAQSPAVTGIWRVNQKIRALSLSIIPKKKKSNERKAMSGYVYISYKNGETHHYIRILWTTLNLVYYHINMRIALQLLGFRCDT